MTDEVNEAERTYLGELYDNLELAELIELQHFVASTRTRASRALDIYDKPSRDWLDELSTLNKELCLAIQIKSDVGHLLAAQAKEAADAWRPVVT